MPVDLTKLDYVLVLDKSSSMETKDCPGGKSRWDYAQEYTLGLARKAEKFDGDGITVVPFAGTHKVYDGVTADKVAQVFRENEPNGSTDTAAVLKRLLDDYFDRKAKGAAKPVVMFVVTDGEPTDQDAVAKVIAAATKRMDRDEEIAIQFIQIGEDKGAERFLAFLDDGLQAKHGAKFDIVDTNKLAAVEGLTFQELVDKSFED